MGELDVPFIFFVIFFCCKTMKMCSGAAGAIGGRERDTRGRAT